MGGRDVFGRRLRRAADLERRWPFASDLLRFYARLLPVQGRIHAEEAAKPPAGEGFSPWLGELLEVVATGGPDLLAREARDWRLKVDERWREEHARPHRSAGLCEDCPSPLYHFLSAALLQPLRTGTPVLTKSSGDFVNTCPACGEAPAAGVLREDRAAETVRRSLVCGRCAHEWPFPRIACPSCGEERPEKLPRLTAEEIPWIRVEACDACGKYLKSVDLTKDPEAEPVVDELASTPLDVVAREKGYVKIAPNLAGL